MIFERFYLSCLSHASYMLGSDGIAAVIDPQRDVNLYLEAAARHGLTIRYVIETHLHADFVSGHRELASLTGAEIWLGAASGAQFPHTAATEDKEIRFGRCKLGFLETPGHTLESISILVTDLDRSPEPYAVLTGDTLFIGDVGRPDLSGDLTPQQLAGMLYDSLHQKLLRLPDQVEVHPAHGAGSLCGRQLGSESSSTIGKEKANNYALRARDKDEFIQLLTAEMPVRPAYFARDVELNRAGAAPLEARDPLPALSPEMVAEKQAQNAVILDTRPAQEWGPAHIPGSLEIGLGGQYASWAGIILGLDQEVVLITEDAEQAETARTRLARVGIERVTGYLEGGMVAWIRKGMPITYVPQVSVTEFHDSFTAHPEIQLIDVRNQGEWSQGHIAGATLKPLSTLSSSLTDLDRSRPVAVYCKGGYRSTIGASVLEHAGFKEVWNLTGGFDAWKTCSLPVADGGVAHA